MRIRYTRSGLKAALIAALVAVGLNVLGFGLLATFAVAAFAITLAVIIRGVRNAPLRFAEAADAEDLEIDA